MSAPPAGSETLGPVEVGPVAHGGHCVARLDGRAIFVRHAIPGEVVRVRVTDDSHDRFWRADAVEIVRASPDRVIAPCPVAGPGGCGGCDFQHVELAAQRRLKRDVVAEQLRRLAAIDWAGDVEAAPGPADRVDDGLGWRTRMRYQVDEQGCAGLRAHRSHDVVPLPAGGCRIAAPTLPVVVDRTWPAHGEVLVATGPDDATLSVDGAREQGDAVITERVGGRSFRVDAGGFWQVHPAAAAVLTEAVLEGLAPREGERALDLYCGVGVFAGALADRGCQVWGVEADRRAIEHARHNLRDVGRRARFTAGRVERALRTLPHRTDLVVLDPPRSGAGRRVMAEVASRRPRAIAYVACDPAALARDLAAAREDGYVPASIRAVDLFPMTHHVECVAVLTPA